MRTYDTPTPRTDAFAKSIDQSNFEDSWKDDFEEFAWVTADFARTLETELTAVTEQRDEWGNLWADLSRSCVKDLTKLERKLTAVTEQRDRLAEALKKAKAVYTPSSGGEYQTGWHDAICWVNQQALQSLNQPTEP